MLIGHHEKPIHETDLVTFSLGIMAGLFLGYFTIKLGGIPFGIGSAGGLLVAGLVVGWLRTRNPMFGRVPAGARFILMELGLLLYFGWCRASSWIRFTSGNSFRRHSTFLHGCICNAAASSSRRFVREIRFEN